MSAGTATSTYQTAFERLHASSAGSGPAWLSALRKGAIESFVRTGFPTTREERWRTTNVAPIAGKEFALAGAAPEDLAHGEAARAVLGFDRGIRLVFVNGRLSKRLSSADRLPAGLVVGSLAEALASRPELVEPYLARGARAQDHPFVAFNTAFFEDGAFVHLPPGEVVQEPILLVFLTMADAPTMAGGGACPAMSHPRVLVVAGRGSQATIVESYAGPEGRGSLTNAVVEIALDEDANVDHYKLQQESASAFHVAVSKVRLGRGAALTSHTVSLGGALVRNEVDVLLAEEGCDCTLNGLFLGTGTQHVDMHTTIDHSRPRGSSREVFKGILDGRAHGVFDGRIIVRPDARKTDSRQTNRNLLLSEDALVDTKPQLEILNDDVKCSHAATIGRLDEDSLFYLRSRGIDRQAARVLLVKAFASDVLSSVRLEPLRRGLEATIGRWLEGRAAPEETAA